MGIGPTLVIDPLWGDSAGCRSRGRRPGRAGRPDRSVGGRRGDHPVGLRARQDARHPRATRTFAVPYDVLAHGYRTLVAHAAAGRIRIDLERVPLDQAVEAWRRQAGGPDTKLVVCPADRPRAAWPRPAKASPTRAIVGGCALGVAVGWHVTEHRRRRRRSSPTTTASRSRRSVSSRLPSSWCMRPCRCPRAARSTPVGARRVGFVALADRAAANCAGSLVAAEPALAIGARALAGVGTALGFVAGIDYVRSHGGSAFAQGLYGGVALARSGVALAVVPTRRGLARLAGAVRRALVVAAGAACALLAGPSDSAPLAPEPRRERPRRPARRACCATGACTASAFVYMASFGLASCSATGSSRCSTERAATASAAAGAVGSLILLGGHRQPPARRLAGAALTPTGSRSVAGAELRRVSAVGRSRSWPSRAPSRSRLVGRLVLGLASGIPFAACFAAARVPAGRAGGRDRDGEHGGEPPDRRRHAAARARVLAPGRRPDRLRRRARSRRGDARRPARARPTPPASATPDGLSGAARRRSSLRGTAVADEASAPGRHPVPSLATRACRSAKPACRAPRARFLVAPRPSGRVR